MISPYPLADVKISVGKGDLSVRAAVSKTLPASLLLRRDVPELMTLLRSHTAEQVTDDAPLVLASMTRSQAKHQQQEEVQTEEQELTSLELYPQS